ncbi:MAG: sulfatase [Lentisphaeraceae bacterium]|nr:sulfatase [Lentisphaeraceae bacterium]
MKNCLTKVAMLLLFLILPSMANERPNIVFIFSDDHAFQAIGAYGSRLKDMDPTPNIDKLAAEGMRFDRFYVGNSICAPSRATLLTGKHSHLNGKLDNKGSFNHDQQTFPKLLQKAGYQTAIVGKTHLAGKIQGFDYWETLPGQGNYYQPDFDTEEGRKTYEGYVTDITTDKSLDWLKNKRKSDKPFMLMIHQKAPHRSWCPPLDLLTKWDDITVPEPDSLFDDYNTRTTAAHKQDMSIEVTMNLPNDLKVKTPEHNALMEAKFAKIKSRNKNYRPSGERGIYYRMTPEQRKVWDAAYNPKNQKFLDAKLTGKDLVRWKYQRYMKDYLRCIYAVDQGVGKVMDYLKEQGLDKNTIVMYSSDQGFYLGEHGWFDKRFMYEESFRTPLVVKWPAKIKAGSVNTDLAQNIDFATTFLDLAGAEIPADLQGRSMVPLFKGEKPADWRKSLYYTYYEYPHGSHSVRKHEGVSTKRYKLIRFYGTDVPNGEEWEFYDLETDPKEMNNSFNNPEYASKIKELKAELQNLRVKYKAPELK